MSELFVVVVILAVALVILSKLVHKTERAGKFNFHAKALLTSNELEFFQRLQKALPDMHICPQVSFGAILKTAKGKHNERGYFSQKIADFLVCEPSTMNVVAVVELDDRTHSLERDQKRDQMLESAGYKVIRFQSRNKPSDAEIRQYFMNDAPKFQKDPVF